MKSITILLLHMQYGGIEKQTITLANELSKKYKVRIVSTYSMKKDPAYPLSNDIEIKYLIDDAPNRDAFKTAVHSKNIIEILKQGFKATKILYLKNKLMIKEIKNLDSDYVLSTRLDFAKLLSKYAPKNVVKITQEHLHDDSKKYIKKVQNYFKNLDCLVVLCNGSQENYSKWLQKNSKIKIIQIPNMLEHIPEESATLNRNSLIAVGRLHPVKNFKTLIEVFSMVNKKIPDSKLSIVGDGEELQNLKKLAKNLNLIDNIEFKGMLSKEQVIAEMLNSDLYVMTSKTECFPMVLLEAESCGLPVISFDVPVGPKAIIENNFNGYLIQNENISEMANKIIDLLTNREKLHSFGENSKEKSFSYSIEKIMPLWYKLFN